MAVFESPADYFRFFAAEAARGGSPLYERLALGLAQDEYLQGLAKGRKKGQPPANLVLAAVHYLLLTGTDDPLKDYYPSVGGSRAADDGAWRRFGEFCRAHEMALRDIIATRVTNTNEVGRSALVAPLFDLVALEAGAPLALVELGPSAGLNLNFDRYGFCYRDENGRTRLERRLNSHLVITCVLRGEGVPTLGARAPEIASRVGLELNPVDLRSASERSWLKALVWPERLDRLAKLKGALEIAVLHPPPIIAGDAAAELGPALAAIPRTHAACVFHTAMAYQLSDAHCERIEACLVEASERAPVWRVSAEIELSKADANLSVTHLRLERYTGGEKLSRELGLCDPHGLWLEWVGS